MKRAFSFLLFALLTFQFVLAQKPAQEDILKKLGEIKSEASVNPQTINYVSQMADEIGPRITWSPGFDKSIQWGVKKLEEIGISNSHFEEWEPKGKSWEIKKNVVNQLTPYFQNLIAYPRHFSPGVKGTVKGKAVYVEIRNEADFEKYKGKLNGAVAFTSILPNYRINYNPLVIRYADADMKKFESAQMPNEEEKRKAKEAEEKNTKATMDYFHALNKMVDFCIKEGAVAIVEHGARPYGSINSLSALLPKPVKNVDEFFYAAADPNEKTLPQITLSLEQYTSIVRTVKNGIDVNIEITLDIQEGKLNTGKNVIAEIPGTDLKNEIVMIGGHIDTQGPSIGAADNAVGAAVCMEAMRLLKKTGVQPRRTIRIALWGGEEEGYLGSKAYVNKHFASPDPKEKCYMYFNTDNGAGKFRGIYMEEREELVPTMKKWFEMINMNLVTAITKTSNTDHVPFNEKGIPGFQFIQDPLDYFRTYHTNMDRIERIPADDVRDNAIIMASLAYLAAME